MRGDRRRRGEPGPHGGDRARAGRRRDRRAAGEGGADERGRGRRPRGGPPLPARGHPSARGIRNRRARRAARPGGDRRRLPRPTGRVPRCGPVRPCDARDHGADDRGAGGRHAGVHGRPGDLRAGGDVPPRRRLPGDPADGGRRAVATDEAGGKDDPAAAARGNVGTPLGGVGAPTDRPVHVAPPDRPPPREDAVAIRRSVPPRTGPQADREPPPPTSSAGE